MKVGTSGTRYARKFQIGTLKNTFLLALLAGSLAACNFGSSGTNPPPTPYLFSQLSVAESGQFCSGSTGNTVFNCATTSDLYLKIAYTSQPAAVVVLGTQLPFGVIESAPSGICAPQPVTNNYSCTFRFIAANVESGAFFKLVFDGSLGQESFITVTYQ